MKCKCDYSMEGRIAGNIKDFSWVCPICKEVNHFHLFVLDVEDIYVK